MYTKVYYIYKTLFKRNILRILEWTIRMYSSVYDVCTNM